MATTDYCDGDYLGAYRRFLEHFVSNVCTNDQLPVKTGHRDVRECEVVGEIADITLQHLNQRICPPSLQAYLVKLVIDEFKKMFQKSPEDCGYRLQDKVFSPLKLMQAVTNKVNEICQRYLDNSRLALLPPPPSTPLPLASSYAIRNKRRKMEDRSVVLHDLHTMFSIKNDAVVNYYAVFDGHAGQEAAIYCAAHLHQYLIESPYYPANPELALRDAFQTTDYRFIESDDTKNSGATAVCALLYDKTLYIAWAGDSQATLIKNGRGINLTIPHKPERPDEKLRIESLGGEIIHFGTWRVNGILSVSRSLGDAKYKPFVSEEPDIKKIELDGSEDFLIVACDGFWERATEDIVASLLYEYVCSSHCEYNSASEALVNWAKQNLSKDNISVIVVFLTPPSEIAAKSFFDPRQCYPTSMEQQEQPLQQQPYDLDFGYGKQQQPLHQPNGNDENAFAAPCVNLLDLINNRYRLDPLRYSDDEDEENERENVDLGPETNVDAVDEVPEDYGKLDQAMGQNYPDEFLLNVSSNRQTDEFPMEMKKHHQNDLILEADNVADSEDSEDEWNYYRPDDKSTDKDAVKGNKKEEKEQQQQQQEQEQDQDQDHHHNREEPEDKEVSSHASIEKPDRCEEERETCSPKPNEDDSPYYEDNRPASSADADADDVTAEYDELRHESIVTGEQPHQLEQQEQPQLLKENDTEAETLPEEDFPFEIDQKQLAVEESQLEQLHLEQEQFEEQFRTEHFEQDIPLKQSEFEQIQSAESEFKNSEFEDSHVEQLEEPKPELQQPQFEQSELEQPTLEQLNLEEPHLEDTEVAQPQVENFQFEQPHLEKSEFEPSQVEKSEFETLKVEKSEFEPLQVEKSEFEPLQVEKSEFEPLQVEKSEFEQSQVEKSEIEQPHLEQSEIEKLHQEQSEIEQSHQEQLEIQQTQIEQFEELQTKSSEFEKPRSEETEFEKPQSKEREFEKPQSEETEFEKPQSKETEFEKPQSEEIEFEKPQSEETEFEKPQSEETEFEKAQSEETEFEKLQSKETEFEEKQSKQIEELQPEKLQHNKNEEDEVENMESHLNPDAAEFVPHSIPLISQMDNELLAGSPLKQSQRALKSRKIPSEEEFQEEVCRRPSEIDDSFSDFSNGEYSPSPRKVLHEAFDNDKEKVGINQLNLDESEISSTKAEFGDESTANYSVTSESHKTGLSTIDCSYTGSDRSDFDFTKDAMMTSMTPGDFKNAFEQELDLNKVHDLTESDIMEEDIQNGTLEENNESMLVDNDKDELSKENIEQDMDNFIPQQEQNAVAFLEVVEQKISDNKDLFMNKLNSENLEKLQDKENCEIIGTSEHNIEIASMENEKVPFTSDDMPTYASNNPFSADYVPATDVEGKVDNLTDIMQNVNLNESKQEVYDDNAIVTSEESEIPKDNPVEVLEKNIHQDVVEENLDENENEKEKDIHEDFIEKDVHEEFIEKGIHEDIMENEKEKDIHEDFIEKDIHEDFIEKDIHEDFIEKDIHEELIEKGIHEDIMEKDIHEDIMEKDIHEDIMEKDVHEYIVEKHEHEELINKEIAEKVMEKDIHEDEMEKGVHEEIMQKSILDNIMQNPLDLNFGTSSTDEKIDEPVLVSPVVDPEVMTSKFAEENLISKSEVVLQEENKKEENESFINTNYVEDLSPIKIKLEENVTRTSLMDEVQENVVENLERKSINLSESLQEFTGFEEQLSSKQNEVKDNICTEELQTLKEDLADEQKDVEEVPTSSVLDLKTVQTPVITNESSDLLNKSSKAAPIVAAAAAVAAVTTAAVSAVAPKSAKTSTSKTPKPAANSKIGAKSTTPTSPTKSNITSKTNATAKKPATTSTPRPKAAPTAASKTAASTQNKAPTAAKSTIASKTSTNTAAKASARSPAAPAVPKTKPLNSLTSKTNSASADKKPTTNGEVKPAPKATAALKNLKPPASSTASKTGLVKNAPTSRTTTGSTSTNTAPKARTANSATTKTTSRSSTSNVTNSVNSTATTRPKTAPTLTPNATSKSKVGTKSPVIDKQIKETANKQISSARSTTTTKTRLSSVTSSTTTAAKRTTLVSKQSTTNVNASPTKKPAPITKPGSKTSATSKGNSKVSSTTKSTVADAATTKVVQNGICKAEETKINSTTTTTNIEEDLPKKDMSPIEPVTDNQLITAE